MKLKNMIITLAIVGILIFSAIGTGTFLINNEVEYIPHQNIQYTNQINENTPKPSVLDDGGTIILIDEGFEVCCAGGSGAATPAGWTNTGWLCDYYGAPCEGSHWAYSWSAGDTLTTPILELQSDTTLTFQNAAENPAHPMDLEVYVDGTVLVWSDYGYTHTDCVLNTVDLSSYSGDHTISFVGLISDTYGQILDDILVTTVSSAPPEDIQSPQINNVNAQPNPQSIGGFVNISCEVTDDYDVDLVKVNVTDPNDNSINVTMFDGNYYNNTYNIIGTYDYFIWANDTSGNSNISQVETFTITENIIPSIHVEKLVWNGTGWSNSAIVFENDIVEFNVSIYNPFDEYEIHWTGNISDQLPCNLLYIEGSTTLPLEGSHPDLDPEVIDLDNNTVWWQVDRESFISPHEYLNFSYSCRAICCEPDHYLCNNLTVSPHFLINECDPSDKVINDGSLSVSDFACVKVICEEPHYIDVTKYVKKDGCSYDYEKYVSFEYEGFDYVTFKLYVNVTGSFDIVNVEDCLPSHLSYVSGSAKVDGVSNEPILCGSNCWCWEFTSVPDDKHYVITFRANVEDCGDTPNHVDVSAEYDCDNWLYDDDEATVEVTGCEPRDITVEKSVKWDCTPPFVENVTANIGDYVTFRIYVNISDGEMFDSVIVHDVLPDGLSYIDGSTHITGITIPDEEPVIDGNVLTWEFSYLSDVSILIEFRANVILCGELVNYVNVTGTYCWQQTEFDEDTAIVWVPCAPGIVVDKQASLDGVNWVDDVIDVFVGDIVFFKINVSNTGDQVLDGVVVKDILPSFLTFNNDADPENIYYSVPDNEIRWFFSHIPVDEYRLITFSATVTETGIGENIAIVTTCGGPDADDSVTIDASGGMHVEKLVSLDGIHWVKNVTADVGDTVRFIINISYFTDDPTLTLFDFYIKDTLPDGLAYANDAYPTEPEITGKTLYWNFTGDDDFMLSGDYLIIAFNATVVGDGEMINIVNVTARECSDTILFGEDEAIVYVEPGPSMICEKTVQATDGSWVDEINANVGDTVRFNITISNIGYYPIYGIDILDTLPSILTYVEDSAVIIYNGETIDYCLDVPENNNVLLFDNLNLCTGDYLYPGENISLLFSADVVEAGIGVNLANVTACKCNQCTMLTCSDTATVNATTPAPELIADASGSPTTINEGDSVSFAGSATGGVPPYSWSWDFDDGTSHSNLQNPTHQFNNYGQYTVILTVTDEDDNTDTDTVYITVNKVNTKPNKPNKPTGKINGKKGEEYTYSTSATDPDGDQLRYQWDWGGGNISEWSTLSYASGVTVTASHTWGEKGSYEIKVRVKDPDDLLSDWSDPLPISMPYNWHSSSLFVQMLEKLIERFPLLEWIISLSVCNG